MSTFSVLVFDPVLPVNATGDDLIDRLQLPDSLLSSEHLTRGGIYKAYSLSKQHFLYFLIYVTVDHTILYRNVFFWNPTLFWRVIKFTNPNRCRLFNQKWGGIRGTTDGPYRWVKVRTQTKKDCRP
jgi:hypothetical protein